MKKFITKIILFFLIIFILDTACGFIFKFLQTNSKGGSTYRMEYIANSMKDSIVIMGSSRAIHHYDSRIFIDSIGLPTFNCGLNGNGIIFNYGQYLLLKERYNPKIIIYDLYAPLDLGTYYPNERYLDGLRKYYDRRGIDSIFYSVDPNEKYKMLSQMRRYNGHFTSVLLDYIKGTTNDIFGYRPLSGEIDYDYQTPEENSKIIYDKLKLKYFEKLISETQKNNTKLVFCISPVYKGGSISNYEPIINLAKNNGIPIFIHYNDTSLINNKHLFKDSQHLNSRGADVYTNEIIKEIKSIVEG